MNKSSEISLNSIKELLNSSILDFCIAKYDHRVSKEINLKVYPTNSNFKKLIIEEYQFFLDKYKDYKLVPYDPYDEEPYSNSIEYYKFEDNAEELSFTRKEIIEDNFDNITPETEPAQLTCLVCFSEKASEAYFFNVQNNDIFKLTSKGFIARLFNNELVIDVKKPQLIYWGKEFDFCIYQNIAYIFNKRAFEKTFSFEERVRNCVKEGLKTWKLNERIGNFNNFKEKILNTKKYTRRCAKFFSKFNLEQFEELFASNNYKEHLEKLNITVNKVKVDGKENFYFNYTENLDTDKLLDIIMDLNCTTDILERKTIAKIDTPDS